MVIHENDQEIYDKEGEEDCLHCGGSGFTHHDCGEDTCPCLEPENNVPCNVCNPHERVNRKEVSGNSSHN